MMDQIYRDGWKSCSDGHPEAACPYPPQSGNSAKRTVWFNGYFDCRTGNRLAHVFKAHNIEWP